MKTENTGVLSQASKRLLLTIAREAIRAHLEDRAPQGYSIDDAALRGEQGAFVTLTLAGKLRGCIGHVISNRPLHETVAEVAVAAATRDPRFSPLTRDELQEVKLEISVLSPLELVTRVEDIEVGVHGLYITHINRSGLLLPQVAVAYGWNRTEFLEQTCKKAWLEKDDWRDPITRIYRFSACVFSEGEGSRD